MTKTIIIHRLMTKHAYRMKEQPWQEYPRPMMKRDSYFCLNGKWDFGVRQKGQPNVFDYKILVPFSPESALSGGKGTSIFRVYSVGADVEYAKSHGPLRHK